MSTTFDIYIPNTEISLTPKPYTVYNISLRLPLRSFSIQKRYSDFTIFHNLLTSQAGAPPPALLPQKSWFHSTVSSPELTEVRRAGLEAYLRAINAAPDERWRNTTAWRTFLNLPSNITSRSSTASGLRGAITSPGVIRDPVVWLDCHRDLKSQLHDVRLQLTRRDQAVNAQAQHECSALAKKGLIKAGTMIQSLDTALQNTGSASWSSNKLGEGELRRRRDLVASTKREKEGLENLLNVMVAKSEVDKTVADIRGKKDLAGNGQSTNVGKGRVLGKETERTRVLGNQGVLQLQRQMMQEQDEDVEILAQAVRRSKELGIAINNELRVGEDYLKLLDEDVDRVTGKINVARKRVQKIS